MTARRLDEIYGLLFAHFGPQHWWPGQTPFEIIIGAILTQNTNWTNVEKAIANLKSAASLAPEAMHRMQPEKLADLIRPAGYYNIKAARIRNFLAWLCENHNNRLQNLQNIRTDTFRQQLLAIKGIGPETADSILLYAFDRQVFVVDAYTSRIAVRHHLIEPDHDYHQLQQLFQSNLPADTALFNEFHALLVSLAKQFCRPKAQCRGCPLEKLPHSLDTELL